MDTSPVSVTECFKQKYHYCGMARTTFTRLLWVEFLLQVCWTCRKWSNQLIRKIIIHKHMITMLTFVHQTMTHCQNQSKCFTLQLHCTSHVKAVQGMFGLQCTINWLINDLVWWSCGANSVTSVCPNKVAVYNTFYLSGSCGYSLQNMAMNVCTV
jgi:hypothetical protein